MEERGRGLSLVDWTIAVASREMGAPVFTFDGGFANEGLRRGASSQCRSADDPGAAFGSRKAASPSGTQTHRPFHLIVKVRPVRVQSHEF